MSDFKLTVNKRLGGGPSSNTSFEAPVKETATAVEYSSCTVEKNINVHAASGVTARSNTVKNTSEADIRVSRASSLFLNDIAPDFHHKDVLIHICNSAWQGEAQWVTRTPYDMGIYPVSSHDWSYVMQTVSSIGSWSTAKKHPIVIIEDKSDGKAWFFEIQTGANWCFEFGVVKSGDIFCISLDCTACKENFDGFYKILKPGEGFETPTVLYGIASSFEDAAGRLITYKRAFDRRFDTIPVCFNDYMNCLWGMPTKERLIPLIDKAAEAGVETFCIDAGWFWRESENGSFGDYIEQDDKFGEAGLKGILEYITSKGMKPGLWFEFETILEDSKIVKISPDAVLKRDGTPIRNYLNHKKLFLNFNCKEVRAYLHERVRYFYDMGMRFIKNDYNQCVGIGCETDGSCSLSAGLTEHTHAFYSFIDELYADMPDLVLENCGSGAMRCDNETLRHFYLQSTSDQEDFFNNPSIIRGMQGFMPPEKMGIWSFPYPALFDDRLNTETLFNDEYKASMADGEQTVYNMALTLFGIVYLSGHISQCDDYNFSLIKKAIELYKADRNFVREALPVFIGEQQKLYTEGYSIMALKTDRKLKLGVFKNGGESSIKFAIPKEFANGSLTEIYPCKDKNHKAALKNGVVRFKTDKKLCAAVYEIKLG